MLAEPYLTWLPQVAAYLNERDITTPRGSMWTALAVQRVLKVAARPARARHK
jgi:hypothetical protein